MPSFRPNLPNPVLAGLCLLCLCGPLEAKSITWAPDSEGRTQVELYLNAYYSALNYARPLTEAPIKEYDSDSERQLYWDLLFALPFPRDVLVEASVNPVPLAGVGLRRHAPGVYEGVEVNGFNLVQAATEDFPDPWAISLFFGNVARLVSASDSGKLHGQGYSGLLTSFGNRHIVGNRMIGDNWMELELKLKGEDMRTTRNLDWSFRAGVKLHDHPDIRDAWCFAIKRSRTDFAEAGWGFLHNSALELRLDLDRKSMAPMRLQAIAGKKIPFAGGKVAATLDLGVIRQLRSGYDGALRSYMPERWTFVLRPNLDF